MKTEGVPVELKVATSFWAIIPLLPIPVIITLPVDASKRLTTDSKSPLSFAIKSRTELLSISSVRRALSKIVSFVKSVFKFLKLNECGER